MDKHTVEVCLSPLMLDLYSIEEKIVVVVDIFRATSTIATALANGVEKVKPVADLEICRSLKEQGYIIAGERGGNDVEGFDMGNSPYEFIDEKHKGAKLALTTTNGTLAIEKAAKAKEVVTGAFLHLEVLADYIKSRDLPVLVLCAGWKGKFNLEDSLFAGALLHRLTPDLVEEGDASQAVKLLYQGMMNDLNGHLVKASHARRLNSLEHKKDIDFCLQIDQYEVIPVLREGHLELG